MIDLLCIQNSTSAPLSIPWFISRSCSPPPPTFRPSLNLFHSKLVVYCSLLSLVYIFYTCALKKKKTLISFIVSKSFILLYTFGFLYCLFSITDFLFISLIVNFHTFISVFNSLFVYFILFFIYLIFFFHVKCSKLRYVWNVWRQGQCYASCEE